MEKIVKQTLLFDFYGELLTEHQKQIYSDFVFNDIGISEIAEEKGISRQGVHDMIKRCDKLLEGYEGKLHLLEKFEKIKAKISGMGDSLDKLLVDDKMDVSKKDAISSIKEGLLEIIQDM